MIHDWELYSVQQDVDPEVVKQSTEVAQGMVTWMRKIDLSPREPIATDESTEAHDCENTHCTLQNIRQTAALHTDYFLLSSFVIVSMRRQGIPAFFSKWLGNYGCHTTL